MKKKVPEYVWAILCLITLGSHVAAIIIDPSTVAIGILGLISSAILTVLIIFRVIKEG